MEELHYLQDLFTPSAAVPRRSTLRSASRHDLVLQTSTLKFGDRSSSVAGPLAWNSLPIELIGPPRTHQWLSINLRQSYSPLHMV